jgi:hypothetical protein
MGLLLMSALPATLDAARGDKTEVLPAQKPVPPVVVIETTGGEMELRRQLRAKNGVAELGSSTSSIRFSQAPTGTFGFIPPQFLGIALVTQSPDLVLERVQPAPNAYEVHKLADGSGMVVGFVGADLLPQLAPILRPKTVRIALYSNPSGKASHIVAVPLVKLASDRMPIWLDRKNPESAVKLEMDLLASVTRQPPQGPQ